MFDEWLRLYKDRLLAPLARRLTALSPDAVTLASLVVGLGAAAAILAGRNPLALALWLTNRTLDGLDGTMARVHRRSSDLGAYLDIMADFVVYAAIPVALAIANAAPVRLAVLVLLATFYLNAASWMYLAALLERRGRPAGTTAVVMPAGLVAGAETIVFYSLAIVFPDRLEPIAYTMAALVLVGVAQRVHWAVRTLQRFDDP